MYLLLPGLLFAISIGSPIAAGVLVVVAGMLKMLFIS